MFATTTSVLTIGRLEILNIEFQSYRICKVIECIENYKFDINHVTFEVV